MLLSLHIENLAVIETADIDFGGGLSVLTGETGAGKSMIIDALGMILGGRTSKDIIRTGCKKAFVSAVFTDIPKTVSDFADEYGFDISDGELLLSRDVTVDGKSTARVNGRQITAAMLKTIGNELINIHGQHDNAALSDSSTHLSFLDSYAMNNAEFSEYQSAYESAKTTAKKLKALNVDESEKERKTDLLKYQINEIEEANLVVGEEETLEKKRFSLMNREKLVNGINAVCEILVNGEVNARDMVSQAQNELSFISRFDEDVAAFSERMNNIFAELDDLSDEIGRFSENFDGDISELDEVENRLELLKKFSKKYGQTVPDILAFLENAKSELESIEFSDEKKKELSAELEKKLAVLDKASKKLTLSRVNAAKNLEKAIMSELSFLDMPKVVFSVDIKPKKHEKDGADSVEFLISTNVGEELRSLAKIASGGELSRIMLAIKSVLSKIGADTLIFDEIDTGVSGRAAYKIAVKLKNMAKTNQVIVVTHLAQIAALAENHYRISKQSSNGRTYTNIDLLDENGRINEVARIMGGENITQSFIDTAAEMINDGKKI